MISLHLTDAPFSLDDLAARVRASSNFRMNWQFYRYEGLDPASPPALLEAINLVCTSPSLHAFLRDSYDNMYEPEFHIEPVHEHCKFIFSPARFENILASAAGDHAGAYSRELRDATRQEQDEISQLFRQAGSYLPFELGPGNEPGCPGCRNFRERLFTNWFDCVAWDWCLLAIWPDQNLLWLGCLTDTD